MDASCCHLLIAVRISKPHRDEPAVRHLQCLDESLGFAVFCSETRDGVGLAYRQSALRGTRQTFLPQRARACSLEDPNRLAAILIRHLEVEHGMRIDPLHLLEGSGKLN